MSPGGSESWRWEDRRAWRAAKSSTPEEAVCGVWDWECGVFSEPAAVLPLTLHDCCFPISISRGRIPPSSELSQGGDDPGVHIENQASPRDAGEILGEDEPGVLGTLQVRIMITNRHRCSYRAGNRSGANAHGGACHDWATGMSSVT
jgi:hypothetical protein